MSAINPFWKKVEADVEETKENVESTAVDIDEIVQGALRGEYGSGEDRKKANKLVKHLSVRYVIFNHCLKSFVK